MVTAATIYMSLLGHEGLTRVANRSQQNTAQLAAMLTSVSGVKPLFAGPHFHEIAISLDRPVAPVLRALASKEILGGFDLSCRLPGTSATRCWCARPKRKTADDLERYRMALSDIMSSGHH